MNDEFDDDDIEDTEFDDDDDIEDFYDDSFLRLFPACRLGNGEDD